MHSNKVTNEKWLYLSYTVTQINMTAGPHSVFLWIYNDPPFWQAFRSFNPPTATYELDARI